MVDFWGLDPGYKSYLDRGTFCLVVMSSCKTSLQHLFVLKAGSGVKWAGEVRGRFWGLEPLNMAA